MSDDLISRQAAIDSIEKHLRFGNELYPLTDTDKILNHGYEIAASCVYNLPSAQPHWIPVTERLPEDIRPVIVTWCNTDPASYYQHIVGKRFTGVAHYKSGKWYWYSSTTEDFLAEYGRYDVEEFDEAIEVLAWCELPDPWKGEQG